MILIREKFVGLLVLCYEERTGSSLFHHSDKAGEFHLVTLLSNLQLCILFDESSSTRVPLAKMVRSKGSYIQPLIPCHRLEPFMRWSNVVSDVFIVSINTFLVLTVSRMCL